MCSGICGSKDQQGKAWASPEEQAGGQGRQLIVQKKPKLRFCKLNIPLKEIQETQKYYADHGLTENIVTRRLEEETALQFDKYECICNCVCDASWNNMVFSLYKRK